MRELPAHPVFPSLARLLVVMLWSEGKVWVKERNLPILTS